MPYVTSKVVADAWGVDHNTLCGKFLGHRRRRWHNQPPAAPLRLGGRPKRELAAELALVPVWANPRIAYSGHMEGGWVIPGLDEPVGKLPNFPEGTFAREDQPPLLSSWPEDWNRRHREPTGGYTQDGTPGGPSGHEGPAHEAEQEASLWRTREGPGINGSTRRGWRACCDPPGPA